MESVLFPPGNDRGLTGMMKDAWDASTEGYLFIDNQGAIHMGNDRTRSLLIGCHTRDDIYARIDTSLRVESIPVAEGQWLVLRACGPETQQTGGVGSQGWPERALGRMQEERRRWSRFLHDTVSQDLVVLSFALGLLQKDKLAPHAADALEQSLGMLDRCCRDIRLLSYVLSPPLFEQLGLISAFEWFAGQLQREAGMEVELAFDPLPSVPSFEVQSILFAVLQVCVARSVLQSRKSKKCVTLKQEGGRLTLSYNSVLEPGRSSQEEGEALLKEFSIILPRMEQLGGAVRVDQEPNSVCVVASVPFGENSPGNLA